MSFEAGARKQTDIFRSISRTLDNLKKLAIDKRTRTTLQTRIANLQAYWEKFQANHDKMTVACTEELEKHAYFTEEIYERCEEEYLNAKSEMLERLENYDKPAPSGNDSQFLSHTLTKTLPKISLPKFGGKYASWIPFRDLFLSMIGNNESLSSVEKMHYLKSNVTDEAAKIIANIPVTGETYPRAWEKLLARYENRRALVNAQLDQLFGLKALTRKSSSDLEHLRATVNEVLESLDAIGGTENKWDLFLVYFVCRRLDTDSHEAWELHLGNSSEPPKFDELNRFLEGRIRALETVDARAPDNKSRAQSFSSHSKPQSGARTHVASAQSKQCALCNGSHYISSCPEYRNKPGYQRREIVIEKRLCFNCLGPHRVSACRTEKRCLTCGQNHHTILHGANKSTAQPQGGSLQTDANRRHPCVQGTPQPKESAAAEASTTRLEAGASSHAQISSHVAHPNVIRRSHVLLATAVVTIVSRTGEHYQARALLDQGSEVSFISESLVQVLRLPRRRAAVPIIGIGAQKSSISNGMATVHIISRMDSHNSYFVDALILPNLTAYTPPPIELTTLGTHLQGLFLADPACGSSLKIDLVLGASFYAQVLETGVLQGNTEFPTAQRTTLGWILSGPLSCHVASQTAPSAVYGFQCSCDTQLLELLQRFWIQEDNKSVEPLLTPEEQECETHFMQTHTRDETGRFTVRLPFKHRPQTFGDSRSIALRILKRMEWRFERDDKLETSYSNFMEEYRTLDHMRVAVTGSSAPQSDLEFFLPHHGIIRENSSTTKLRVVFNGSQKTNLGIALNDYFHSGPKMQRDLEEVLLRWRRHWLVFATDIAKMYRQIRVHEEDWPLQQILWRSSRGEPPQAFHLCTVTYGLTSAPFLALRCLKQLAIEEASRYPLAADIVLHDAYVDDFLSGADTEESAKEKISQLKQLLMAGGFRLQKWMSNYDEILDGIPLAEKESTKIWQFDESCFFRTLGVIWKRDADSFVFSPPVFDRSEFPATKRQVLSSIVQLFDPLGWLAPIVISAKIFMQELWSVRLDWDDPLPENLNARWRSYLNHLVEVSRISIPRWLGFCSSAIAIEIHGFSDASQLALGAVVYLRVLNESNEVSTAIVAAKTRVTLLKRVTIPRLELTAAVILVRLVKRIVRILDLSAVPVHLWTDSTVALMWIQGHAAR